MTVGQPMYENGALAAATGGPLRPGGLELTRRLLERCALPWDARILDLGCGDGMTLAALRADGFTRALGVDRSAALLESGRERRAGLRLARARANCLPLAGGQVDAVLGECSFSASADLAGTLAECRRVLRAGGWLALSDLYVRRPEGLAALRALPLSCGLSAARTREDWIAALGAAGFSPVTWEDHSEALKQLMVQAVWTHGSMPAFWSRSEPDADPWEIQTAVSRARLGYFGLVARKV